MLVLPVYDLLLLPGVTFYFKKDILDRMQMRKMKQRKKSKNRTGKICISCMVVVLTLIMSVQIGHLYQVNEGYKQDEKTKQAQLKDEQERSAELQEKEAYVGSDQYIVDTAKSKLGMTYPDEIVFKEK